MKQCIRFAPMIGARPGELTPAEDAALRAHLEGCEACRALAADLAATEGMVSEALLAEANRRDFGPFVDQVMARLEPRTVPSAPPVRARRPSFFDWLAAHRRAAFATLAPVLAAAALVVYVRSDGGPSHVASLELASEGDVTMILQTSDGPVVLLSGEES